VQPPFTPLLLRPLIISFFHNNIPPPLHFFLPPSPPLLSFSPSCPFSLTLVSFS
jgi:hypothetical protein